MPLGLDAESTSPLHDSIDALRDGLSYTTYVTEARDEDCRTIARKFGLDPEVVLEMNADRYPGFHSVKTKLQKGTTILLPL